MSWLLVTDTHMGVRADSPIFVDIQRQFLEDVLFPTIEAHPDITRVVHLGDLRDHRRYCNFVTLSAWRQMFFRPLMTLYKERNIPTFFLVGNHDMPFREQMAVTAVRQLLPKHPAFTVLDRPEIRSWDGRDVVLMPWICDENRTEAMRLIETSGPDLLLGHLELKTFEMFRGMVQPDGMDPALFANFKKVYSGHYHHASARENIQYLGAPYELTWHDYKSPKGVYLLDPDTLETEFIQNPHRTFFKFVYDDEGKGTDYIPEFLRYLDKHATAIKKRFVKLVLVTKTQPYGFDVVYDRLRSYDPQELQVVTPLREGVEDELTEDAPAVDTMATMDALVESRIPEVELHDPVKAALRSLYQRALESARV